MIEALEQSLGIVTTACKTVGIKRNTHYVWLSLDEKYKSDVESVSDIAIDFAESKLHKLIKDENPTAIIFYLKTKAKHRGYVERQEIVNPEPTQIQFINGSKQYEINEKGESTKKAEDS